MKPVNTKDELWLTVPKANFEKFKKQLNIYKIGKSIFLEDVTDLMDYVYVLNNTAVPDFNIGERYHDFYQSAKNSELLKGEGFFDFASVDPRSPLLGHLVLSVKENQITQYFR